MGWSLTGNSGLDDTVNFLGTTDQEGVILKANSTQAGRFYMKTGGGNGPNITLGSGNSIVSETANNQTGGNSILGGTLNGIVSGAAFSVISGGYNNGITNGFFYASIGGGFSNNIGGNGATVPGGDNNLAAGQDSFAAGRKATASNDCSFVWSDYQGLSTTHSNQFLIQATSGVGINTNTNLASISLGVHGAY